MATTEPRLRCAISPQVIRVLTEFIDAAKTAFASD